MQLDGPVIELVSLTVVSEVPSNAKWHCQNESWDGKEMTSNIQFVYILVFEFKRMPNISMAFLMIQGW
jgi:hypothetical protein